MRAAIVGTGGIAAVHVEALRRLDPAVEVVAASDIDPGRLAAFRDRYAIPHGYPDLATLLAIEQPDLVHVCTPPGVHLDNALECLRAGVPAIVEKPPTRSLADLAALADAEKAGGPYLATVFQHRFGSGARRLRALMDAGTLGPPLAAVCHTLWYRDQAYFDVPWRGRWDTEGGGPTMGHGIHQMDLLVALLGEWDWVSAIARRQARGTQTEDLSLAHVGFASGAVASVVNSVLSPREESYLRIDFERATVEVTHLYGYRDEDWRITPAPGHETVRDAWRAGESGTPSGHQAQFARVYAALAAGTVPPVGTAEAMLTMRLIAGVYASAFTGRPVGPDELGPESPFYGTMRGSGPDWEG
jgi:predicted dehydrogenase